ncbi:MAG: N-acetyltransferase [Chloroflexi bacterium]|nr:N-acetyltransferase [Chloroflexota bacterium]MBI2980250.1 N-acetyltransferase [Chloroflexota bacterium]
MKRVEKARISDAVQMHQLINYFADKGEMLARPLSEIYENIRDFFVVREGERVIACAALHVNWADLAEIKAVAVAEESQRKGVGDQLIAACLEEARELGIPTVFCLTYKPVFFERFGFTQVDKMELPQKVWNECYRCPKFPNCDEIACIYHLELNSKEN